MATANNLIVSLSESESLVPSGRAITYVGTIQNISSAAVICTIVPFDNDGGVGGVTSPSFVNQISCPPQAGVVPGTVQFSFQRVFVNKNNPALGARVAIVNCTVYGSDLSVTSATPVQALIYNPDFAPFFAYSLSRWWQYGQANFAALQDSTMIVPAITLPTM